MLSRSTSVGTASRPCPRQLHQGFGLVPNDAVSKRQQAEAAALEAYYRARPNQESALQDYRPAKPTLQRRRSRISGRAEGGHFEDARLGQRKSGNAKSRGEGTGFSKSRSSPQRSSEVRSSNAIEQREGETVITRKRSVIPPGSSYAVHDSSSVVVTSSRRGARLSRSEYTSGSPVPRHPATNREGQRRKRSEALPAMTKVVQEYSDPASAFRNFDSSGPAIPSKPTTRCSERSVKADKMLIGNSRDRCPQDFQEKKVRERKSTIFATLSKLKISDAQKSRLDGFDTWLPPFNYADDRIPMADVPLQPLTSQLPIYMIPINERKSRNFTESLKDRFKKAFGKPSRVVTGLPAQHIEGKTYHFSTTTPSSGFTVVPTKEEDPFSAVNNRSERPDTRADSAISKHTVDTTTKSRITSWTDSTVAGTWSTRSEANHDQYADEQGRLKRSDSVSTLRKAKSFFGKPIQSRLRKASKAQLRSADKSSGLYSALQERINPSDPGSQAAADNDTLTSQTSSALLTLPSQKQRDSLARRNNGRLTDSTIRTVTPDSNAYILNVPSPVAEVLSPDVAQPSLIDSAKSTDESDTPRSQLQRRPAMKAPTPSKDLIARRIERSQHRWQGPLDEMSPSILPKANRAAGDDNPYELRSLSRSLQQAPAASDILPHHARVANDGRDLSTREEAVLSPSVYSRATDEPSPRPDTPLQLGGTMVTITGREVRSYSISPQKPEQTVEKPIQASNEWRRWLSDEWKGWYTEIQPDNLSLAKSLFQDPMKIPPESSSAPAQIPSGHSTTRPDSSSPPLVVPPLNKQPKRSRPGSNHSSFMNERYPMVGTGRDSTDARKISSWSSSGPSSTEPGGRIASALRHSDGRACTAEATRPTSTVHNQRVISKYQSMLGLDKKANTVCPATFQPSTTPAGDTPVIPRTTEYRPSSRVTKSALDLRANYKNKSTGACRSITITRNTTAQNQPTVAQHSRSSPLHILEDTTIQNIAAGPYATSQFHASSSPHPQMCRKENTPPPFPSSEANSDGLPAVSSSEWLAAGGAKRGRNAPGQRKVSRYSPARNVPAVGKGEEVGSGGSPGQRLVTNWLDGKRSKENTPTFV